METPEHFNGVETINPDFNNYTKGHVAGYNMCLERTNAKELYEALNVIINHLRVFREHDIKTPDYSGLINIANTAIKKAR